MGVSSIAIMNLVTAIIVEARFNSELQSIGALGSGSFVGID